MTQSCKRIAQFDEQIKNIQKRCDRDIQLVQNHILSLSTRMKEESEKPCVVTTFPQ
jgi:hypothetical protein